MLAVRLDSPRGQRPGSSVSSASGMERRSISGIDLKVGSQGIPVCVCGCL